MKHPTPLTPTFHVITLIAIALVLISPSVCADSPEAKKSNLANDQLQLDTYLKVADTSGTSIALASQIADAAEKNHHPGVVEWAESTIQLRLGEWALIIAALSLILTCTLITLGIWRRWRIKSQMFAAILPIAGAVLGYSTYSQLTPPTHDAVIIGGIKEARDESETLQPQTDILISPFEGAEITGTLPLATHVLIDPKTSTTDYLRITDPDTQLSGWVRAQNIRVVGQ